MEPHTVELPSSRWGKLCSLQNYCELKPMTDLLGDPVVTATESKMPRYTPGVLQVVTRPDGVWVHSTTLRQWRRRQSYRFLADCNEPSDFRKANPNANTPRPWGLA